MKNLLRQSLVASCLLSTIVYADASCRIAFDMGSSGIRAGASNSASVTHADIDFLGPLLAGNGTQAFVTPTIAALKELPFKARFEADCARVGGGFSAWRLALQQNANDLTATLAQIRAATDVAVLVIPPRQEGAYGHFAARRALGELLTTSHVLDIGGGSMQIAGERSSYVAALGQRAWHSELCRELRQTTSLPCDLQPMSEAELPRARALLSGKLRDIGTDLPGTTSMTAISRPVSRGVLPAVRRLAETDGPAKNILRRTVISAAISRLAPLTLADATAQTGSPAPHVSFLLSDLLLVEGLMRLTGDADLTVAEISATNLPGLLADDRAFGWRDKYACYLVRLREMGVGAYASDPATCR